MQTDSQVVIDARKLTKTYEINSRGGSGLGGLMGGGQSMQLTALRDVTFSLRQGEVVGIIGANGAGKSTLLKVVAGIIKPTSGSIDVKGRVAALLELGAGFNDERTGRENLYIGGLYMGYTREEVASKVDDIIAFSGIGPFIDQPMKIYSTGMKSRLTFSLATEIDPDVLIIDETLSVGDAKFERQSFARIKSFRERGKTILVTSHNGPIFEQIADRVLYLRQGRLVMEGRPKVVNAQYKQDLFGPEESGVPPAAELDVEGAVSKRYGNGLAKIISCGLHDSSGRLVERVTAGERYQLRAQVECLTDRIDGLNVGFSIVNPQGVNLMAVNPISAERDPVTVRKGDVLDVVCDVTMNLGIGNYFVTVGAWALGTDTHFDRRTDVLHFYVTGPRVLRDSLVNMDPNYNMRVASLSAVA